MNAQIRSMVSWRCAGDQIRVWDQVSWVGDFFEISFTTAELVKAIQSILDDMDVTLDDETLQGVQVSRLSWHY